MKTFRQSRLQRKRGGRLFRWLGRLWPAAAESARIDEAIAICRRAAEGDLEARIVGVDADAKFGKLCGAINAVLDLADSYVREASAAMEHCSRDQYHRPILLRGLKGSYRQSAQIINRAAVCMRTQSESIAFVGKKAQETASNVHTVAAACEELSATTTEIASQASAASSKAHAVGAEVQDVNASFDTLEHAVAKIDRVVELLNNLSLQTQLLGLNASIEAAHAGEFGSSFGVVASEIKTLSDETRRATDGITLEIREIKAAAHGAADTLRRVTASMKEFEAAAGVIDGSVAEQVKATECISTSIMAVSQMSEDVSERIRAARGADANDQDRGV